MNTPDTEWEQDGFIYELKKRIKWDYSYYISREGSAGGFWQRVDSIEHIPPHAISTHRTHPIETPDNLFLYKAYKYFSSRDTYWKERVWKEVEGMRIAEGNYNCGEEGCCNPNPKDDRETEDVQWQIGYNTALDTLLDNLK